MRGQTTHPGIDVLAEFRAGVITGHRGERIAAHLAGCERCSAVDAGLAGVPALLAAVPPPAMPAHLAERLDQVLAAEVANRDKAERAADTAPPEPVTSRRTARRGLRLPPLRVLAPVAAAAAVVLAAGGYGLTQLVSSPGGPAGSSVAAGSVARSVASSTGPRAQVRGPVQGTAPGTGAATAPARGPQDQPISFVYLTSRTDFTSATLTRQLTDELGKTPAAAGTVRVTPAAVRGCVSRVAGGSSVIRVETARYQGQAATVIFTQSGPGVRALVTSPDCSGTSGHVVAARTLPAGISGA